MTKKEKRPFYKKVWFWIIILLLIIGIASCGNGSGKDDNKSATVNTPQNKTVKLEFDSCEKVKEAGKAPLHKNDEGYSKKLDRDGDGVACNN